MCLTSCYLVQNVIACYLVEIDQWLLKGVRKMSDSGNFLSALLGGLWGHTSITIGNLIEESLDPVPLHFVRLDLGDVLPRTTNMMIFLVGGEARRTTTRTTRRIRMSVMMLTDDGGGR